MHTEKPPVTAFLYFCMEGMGSSYIVFIEVIRGFHMKRVFGLMLFCFGVGMTLMLFIPLTLTTLIFVIGCLTLGYYLFCS